MPRRSIAVAVAPAALLALALAAGPAAAATVTTLPCVVDVGVQRTLPIQGAGYLPGSLVTVSYTSPALGAMPRPLTSTTADAAGNFVVSSFPAPFNSFRAREQKFGLVATDAANPTVTAATTFRQVRGGVTVSPSRARAGHKVRYTVRGFPVGRNVYAHYRYHGHTRATVKIGRTQAPCGIVSRRMRLLPARQRFGTWNVYVDQRKSFSRATRPQVRSSIFVSRVFG